jgi:hypothetical protein
MTVPALREAGIPCRSLSTSQRTGNAKSAPFVWLVGFESDLIDL